MLEILGFYTFLKLVLQIRVNKIHKFILFTNQILIFLSFYNHILK